MCKIASNSKNKSGAYIKKLAKNTVKKASNFMLAATLKTNHIEAI